MRLSFLSLVTTSILFCGVTADTFSSSHSFQGSSPLNSLERRSGCSSYCVNGAGEPTQCCPPNGSCCSKLQAPFETTILFTFFAYSWYVLSTRVSMEYERIVKRIAEFIGVKFTELDAGAGILK